MRLILLGAPGVGKGTQGDLLVQRFHQPKISTGDILREAVRQQTSLGREAKAHIDKGHLVPDSVVIGIIQEKLRQPECEYGFVLDGIPRTVHQAEELNRILVHQGVKLDRVVNFVVQRAQVANRLVGRRTCPKCQTVFHVQFAPSLKDNLCDRCGSMLVQRSDDKQETVEARLSVYEEQTAPLVEYYRVKGLLSDLPGEGSMEEVQQRLVSLLVSNGIV
jgi:adenylate kinase